MNTDNVNLSEESSDDADSIWQSVPTKRKQTESPKLHQQKRRTLLNLENSTSTNKFSVLDNEAETEVIIDNETTPKPPPIYIPNVLNITQMIKKLLTIVANSEFNYKSLREGQVRLMVKTVDSYRKVVNYLESEKINFHTYQLKQERSFRIVMKGLHHSTPTEDIKAELLLLGHDVRSVVNVKSRVSKEPLSMFFIDLDPKINNKDVYNIKHLNRALVKVEPPVRTNDLVQCHRCQMFGHTKTYCKRPFRCVKCGMDHSTAQCTKSMETPPRCVHCLSNHTASYKGCKVYQDLVSKRPSRQKLIANQRNNFVINPNEYPHLNGFSNDDSNNHKYNVSYSEAVRKSDFNHTSRLEKLENMMENLMNMMSMLMAKLCK